MSSVCDKTSLAFVEFFFVHSYKIISLQSFIVEKFQTYRKLKNCLIFGLFLVSLCLRLGFHLVNPAWSKVYFLTVHSCFSSGKYMPVSPCQLDIFISLYNIITSFIFSISFSLWQRV